VQQQENVVFSQCHFILKNEDLPRQARDKHRKSSENGTTTRFCRLLTRVPGINVLSLGAAEPGNFEEHLKALS
jgi:hypothetical protein